MLTKSLARESVRRSGERIAPGPSCPSAPRRGAQDEIVRRRRSSARVLRTNRARGCFFAPTRPTSPGRSCGRRGEPLMAGPRPWRRARPHVAGASPHPSSAWAGGSRCRHARAGAPRAEARPQFRQRRPRVGWRMPGATSAGGEHVRAAHEVRPRQHEPRSRRHDRVEQDVEIHGARRHLGAAARGRTALRSCRCPITASRSSSVSMASTRFTKSSPRSHRPVAVGSGAAQRG